MKYGDVYYDTDTGTWYAFDGETWIKEEDANATLKVLIDFWKPICE